jgi:hypothetical protein
VSTPTDQSTDLLTEEEIAGVAQGRFTPQAIAGLREARRQAAEETQRVQEAYDRALAERQARRQAQP